MNAAQKWWRGLNEVDKKRLTKLHLAPFNNYLFLTGSEIEKVYEKVMGQATEQKASPVVSLTCTFRKQ